ncbi:23S rRNA (adenine(1618)-N(6))-methyltransferase RlmF [Neolewinella aurantiaca]|nr:23S rRNA (adenine(1618)-N(6))-methyltransferase RlmF [Neolewinella aurantiaca]
MHPKNRYAEPHDFVGLAAIVPDLASYSITTPDGRSSLDFTHPQAVRLLNKALLIRDYGLKYWDIPEGNLCPGVPGRLDYIHAIGDLLGDDTARTQGAKKGKQPPVFGLDVGTGASLIYPILGHKEYGWRMVGTDVDATSLKVATAIAQFNPGLKNGIIVRKQTDRRAIFRNVILRGEHFTFTMCNPPFFDSAEAARAAAGLKWKKLGVEAAASPTLNFGGQANELWTEGGEPAFLRQMIQESTGFGEQVDWFTTLVSKKGYLKIAEIEFGRHGITQTKVIGIGRGGKLRRILCWKV